MLEPSRGLEAAAHRQSGSRPVCGSLPLVGVLWARVATAQGSTRAGQGALCAVVVPALPLFSGAGVWNGGLHVCRLASAPVHSLSAPNAHSLRNGWYSSAPPPPLPSPLRSAPASPTTLAPHLALTHSHPPPLPRRSTVAQPPLLLQPPTRPLREEWDPFHCYLVIFIWRADIILAIFCGFGTLNC